MFGTVFDIEGNSLTPTKLHVLAATNSDTDEPRHTTSYGRMKEFTEETEVFVGHYISLFDIPTLERLLDCKVREDALIIDTLALSWYLYPTRHKDTWKEGGKKGHGLDGWGREFGIKKPEVDDWENLPVEVYIDRCVEDVKITRRLWQQQYKYLLALYGSHEKVVRFLRYLQFKMDCAREQERSRWKLDVPVCEASIQKLEKLLEEKTDELRQAMPKVPATRLVKPPKAPYKRDGEPSEVGKRWFKLLEGRGLPISHDQPVAIITGYNEPNPGSHEQIKEWLYSLGWVPRTFKENKKGIEVPQINKLKQDGGGVCESIQELYEVEPRLEVLDNFFVIQHRLGILRGFLSAVSDDGYVKASIQGLTNTLRFKHSEVVNLPKIDAKFGAIVRECLIAPEGYELCGSDMSSLEDRLKQHFCFKYDPEYVKEIDGPRLRSAPRPCTRCWCPHEGTGF